MTIEYRQAALEDSELLININNILYLLKDNDDVVSLDGSSKKRR